MTPLSKTITMYLVPENSTNFRIERVEDQWKLCYDHDQKRAEVSLRNGSHPSHFMCVNNWNTAVFVRTELPARPFKFPFGKYQGKTVEEVPEYYLEWWNKNVCQ